VKYVGDVIEISVLILAVILVITLGLELLHRIGR
jgi:hypothetical protein